MNMTQRITVIVLALLYLPFLAAYFFLHPHMDDLIFAEIARHVGVADAQIFLYHKALDRFASNAALTLLNPAIIHSLLLYRLCLFAVLILLLLTIFRLVRSALNLPVKSTTILIIAASFLFYFIQNSNEISQTLYWMAATYTYMLGLISELIIISALMTHSFGKPSSIWFAALCVLAFLLPGFNEITLLHTGILLTIIIGYRSFWLNTFLKKDFIVLCCFVAGAVLTVASPGIQARTEMAAQVETAHNLVFAFQASFNETVQQLANWLLLFCPTILLCMLVSRKWLLAHIPSFSRLTAVRWYVPMTVTVFIVWASSFLGIWGTGYPLPPRAYNLIFFHFLAGATITAVCIFFQAKRLIVMKEDLQHKISLVTLTTLCLFFFYTRGNFRPVAHEWIVGKFRSYDVQQRKREQFLKNSSPGFFVVDSIRNPPKSIFFGEYYGDTSNLENYGLASYFNKQGIVILGRETVPFDARINRIKWRSKND
jgi:hypothetical protein